MTQEAPLTRRRLGARIAAALVAALLALALAYVWARCFGPFAEVPPRFDDAMRVSFLAAGRQGYGNRWATEVAAGMGKAAARERTHFVVLTGDNFYPAGVTSVTDGQWQDKFEQLYRHDSLNDLPFYAVLGNHDHRGNAAAQLAYASERLGTGRWRMRGRQYHEDFGRIGDRVLLRIVFLDTVPLVRSRWKRRIARWYLRQAMALPGNPLWRVVAGHAGVRSKSRHAYTRSLVLEDFGPLMRRLDVDLVLSGNDRFQQVLDFPDEPLHVSTNGGGEKLDREVQEETSDRAFVAIRPGFSRVTVDRHSLKVEMMDRHGTVTYRKTRTR